MPAIRDVGRGAKSGERTALASITGQSPGMPVLLRFSRWISFGLALAALGSEDWCDAIQLRAGGRARALFYLSLAFDVISRFSRWISFGRVG